MPLLMIVVCLLLLVPSWALACDRHPHPPMTVTQCADFGRRMRLVAQMRDFGLSPASTASAMGVDLACPDERVALAKFVDFLYTEDLADRDPTTVAMVMELACNRAAEDQRRARKPQPPPGKPKRAPEPLPRAKTRS